MIGGGEPVVVSDAESLSSFDPHDKSILGVMSMVDMKYIMTIITGMPNTNEKRNELRHLEKNNIHVASTPAKCNVLETGKLNKKVQ